MATYYAELTGGEIVSSVSFEGGVIYAEETLSGGEIYPGGGGGGASLETKSVSYTPSETAISDTLTPSAGYDGFDEVDVSVDAIPSNYVGSAIDRIGESDITVSGSSVTMPEGYYPNEMVASIPTAPLPTLSSATINSSGTLGVVANLSSDGYLPSGNLPMTLGNAFTVQGAQTITPTTTDQTISADQYLTGAQTILGDADLVAGNIKKDVDIFGVVGTYEGSGDQNPTAEPSDVNFIDYDGTIRYSYTNAEIALLSELPPNPTHTGLTSQGWNWTLADIQNQKVKMPMQPLWVGQQYGTTSGYTEIDISLTNDIGVGVIIYLGLGVNGTANIDWGDGSAQDTLSGTSTGTQVRKGHTYSSAGNYTIKLSKGSGSDFSFYGTSNYLLMNYNTGNAYFNIPLAACVRAVRGNLSTNYFWFGGYAFYNLKNLDYVTPGGPGISGNCFQNSGIKSFTIRNGRTSLASNAFSGTNLKNISIPKSVTSFSANGFNGSIVPSVCIPYGATSIDNQCFLNANGLHEIWIPETVTSINGAAFNDCRTMRRYHFMRTTPPTLTTGSGFTNRSSLCQFYVPYSADHSILEAYKTASNWSNFASIMVEEAAP